MSNSSTSSQKPRRVWLIPAIIAFVAVIIEVIGNLVANELVSLLKPYNTLVWVIFGIASIIAIWAAIGEARRAPAPSVSHDPTVRINGRNVSVGGDVTESIMITGDENVIVVGRKITTVENLDTVLSEPHSASEEEKFLHDQLARHQENRRKLLRQKSIYAAGEEPLHLLNQIAAEEKAIKEIEQALSKSEQQPEAKLQKQAVDLIHFSAFAPPIVKPQSHFLLYVWAFMETQRKEMLTLASQRSTLKQIGTKGPIKMQRETEIIICVDLPDFEVEETIDTIIWEGKIANTSFAVSVPKEINLGKHLCKAKVICGGIQLARLFFEIEVGLEQKDSKALKTEEQLIRTIFASYASEDRLEVLRWARGAQAVGVDVFLDVLSLREGQYWEKELLRHVPSKDLFCLFWSEPASKSPWVEKEWRCALVMRGLDYIHPVPLVDPRKVPPPKELSTKHFNDLTRVVIEYEQMIQNM